jgi:hypothetical protein
LVYPKALLLSDLVWEDTDRMMKDPHRIQLLDEIIAALVLSSNQQLEYHRR